MEEEAEHGISRAGTEFSAGGVILFLNRIGIPSERCNVSKEYGLAVDLYGDAWTQFLFL
jgi:hypothetical protein